MLDDEEATNGRMLEESDEDNVGPQVAGVGVGGVTTRVIDVVEHGRHKGVTAGVVSGGAGSGTAGDRTEK